MVLTLNTQAIVNFRRCKQDFAPAALREGKALFDKGVVKAAKVTQLTPRIIKIQAQVKGAYANAYTCEIEIDRIQSEIIDSSCDCPATGDCQHLAALIFYCEEELEKLILGYSQERKTTSSTPKEIDKMVVELEKKVEIKQKKEHEKLLLDEYFHAAELLGKSPFFVPPEELNKDIGELAFLLIPAIGGEKAVDVQPVLRLPFRSKPFYIMQPKQFFFSIQTQEPIILAGRTCIFGIDSFGPFCEELIKIMRIYLQYSEIKTDKGITRQAWLDNEGLGEILARANDWANKYQDSKRREGVDTFSLPTLFFTTHERPLLFSETPAEFSFEVDFFTEPRSQIVLKPSLILGEQKNVALSSVSIFECSHPGLLKDGTYFRFNSTVGREHLRHIEAIHKMAIPQELFGTFIEHAVPELLRTAKVTNVETLEDISSFPTTEEISATCLLNYSNGELEARLHYIYGDKAIPDSAVEFTPHHMQHFVQPDGILARNLVAENSLTRELFSGFIKDERTGCWLAKNDRKIVEFMTQIIPKLQSRVKFSCPESLLSQFCYDDTKVSISLSDSKQFDKFAFTLKVDGNLKGISVDYLWDCVSTQRTYIVVSKKGGKVSKDDENELSHAQKILVLKLDLLAPTLALLDELNIRRFDDISCELPLWTLVNLIPTRFEGSLISLKMSQRIADIQQQIFNNDCASDVPLPKSIDATYHHYQIDGIKWLARLRKMGLNGILADDMGLGKTLQAICAITQYVEGMKDPALSPAASLIVCPTSLVDNWKEEFHHFGSKLRVATCTGTPQERKKLLSQHAKYDVIVTSYGLIQKDLELYEQIPLGYLILDEAQAIKNRETRNARSVKKIPARHKLILTGTPLENSLEDLWSLFDFLMPGLIGSFDRFVTNYIKPVGQQSSQALAILRKKVAPFVLRRMKVDVLDDLPSISHFTYNCRLSTVQQDLYSSYAKSAREQLKKLVEKDGFDKARLQVLATLTRLKQICCHPAIFAKENAEAGDSAKYEMLLDLLAGFAATKQHKTVVFSQYTQMLAIMKQDLLKMGIKFSYLDGSSKNRLSIVKQFNDDPDIPVFLVSLKVGGTGLNLVGADTVIHYDMWWNPAVENQATDRVWRIGQKQAVSSYKLVTLDTIEEKIVALQNRKKELLKEIVRSDEEIISKLTWDEVLELLKA